MPRRPGPQVTLQDVLAAAAAVLVRDGYDGLTMRSVAVEVGVQAPSLYWHVKSKADLSLLLFDDLIDNLDYGAPTGDWRADLRRMAQRLRTRLVETRDITRLFPEDYSSGPRATRSLEQGLGLLRQAGLPAGDALNAYGVALSFVVGWSRFEVARKANAHLPPPAASAVTHLPNLAWALSAGGRPDDDDGFRYGVDLLIAGLEQRLGR
ncbi:tetracycline resistance transcriptional repressor TetR(A) [soil metagenome]